MRFAVASSRPKGLPISRPRGIRGVGLRYERAFAKRLGANATAGQWFQFADANGTGYCQCDVLLSLPEVVVIFECKLSDIALAQSQLSKLYLPVVAKALRKPTLGIIVARHLSRVTDTALVRASLGEAVALAASGRTPVLHWLGKELPR